MIFDCTNCGVRVDGPPRGEYFASGSEDGETGTRFSLLECPSCHNPALVSQEYEGHIRANGLDQDIWSSPVQMYPLAEQTVGFAVPETLRQSFGEAITCFRVGAFTACIIMCRKTIEGLCVEKGITGKSLQQSLQLLQSQGVMDQRLVAWADMLRIAGNEAVHGINHVPAKKDAQDILDFCRALLEYVFTFEQRFDEFLRRRPSS